MSKLFCNQTNNSARQEDVSLDSSTIPSNTHPKHHKISQTIFWCLDDRTTFDVDDMNIKIIDISDDDDEEEEDENTCKNGTSIDDLSDEEEIEVIELSDDSEDYLPSDLTYNKMLQQQQTTDLDPSAPSTSRIEQYQSEEDSANEFASRDRVLITIGLACSECSKLYDTISNLEQHLMMEHDKSPFKCMVRGCNEQFLKRFLLNEHFMEHDTNQYTKWGCSAFDCKYETSHRSNFMTHVCHYHKKGLFQCSSCLVQYPYRFMVYNHYKRTHYHYHRDRSKKCPKQSKSASVFYEM